MIVITADQIDSRERPDLAGGAVADIQSRHGNRLLLPADRNAGDEIQMLTDDAATALTIALELTRTRDWSVGIGCGAARTPLPHATREASGPAFFAARDAVERAKKLPARLALAAQTTSEDPAAREAVEREAGELEALLGLLITIRQRRSEQGWELYDLLADGSTQSRAASQLGISPPAATSRSQAAALKAESAAIPAFSRLLGDLDRRASEGAPE